MPTITLNATVGTQGPITLTINTFPERDVLPGEVVIFIVDEITGWNGDPDRDLDFEWDFDDPGAKVEVAYGMRYTDANSEYGRVVSHAYKTVGSKQPTVKVRSRLGGEEATATVPITVESSDAVPWDFDVYVSFEGASDPSVFNSVPPAGGNVYHYTSAGQVFFNLPNSDTSKTRFTFRKGEVYPWSVNRIASLYEAKQGRAYVRTLDGFGTGANPVLRCAAQRISSDGVTANTVGLFECKEYAVWGVDIDGTYDPVAGAHAPGAGYFGYQSGGINAGEYYASLFQCTAKGVRSTIGIDGTGKIGGGEFFYVGISDCVIDGWSNYGISIFGTRLHIGISNSRIAQPPNARLDNEAKQSILTEAADHGPVRTGPLECAGLTNNFFASTTGWSFASGEVAFQPVFRASTTYDNEFGIFWVATTDGGTPTRGQIIEGKDATGAPLSQGSDSTETDGQRGSVNKYSFVNNSVNEVMTISPQVGAHTFWFTWQLAQGAEQIAYSFDSTETGSVDIQTNDRVYTFTANGNGTYSVTYVTRADAATAGATAHTKSIINVQRNRSYDNGFGGVGRNGPEDYGYFPRVYFKFERNEQFGLRQNRGLGMGGNARGVYNVNNVLYSPNVVTEGRSATGMGRAGYVDENDPRLWTYAPGAETAPLTFEYNTLFSDLDILTSEIAGFGENTTGTIVANNIVYGPGHPNAADFPDYMPLDRTNAFRPVTGSTAIGAVTGGFIPVRDFEGNLRTGATNPGAHHATSATAGVVGAPLNTSPPVIAEMASYPGEYHVTDLGEWDNITGDDIYRCEWDWRLDDVKVPNENFRVIYMDERLYWIADSNANAPSAQQVEGGKDGGNADAQASGRIQQGGQATPTFTIDPGLATAFDLWLVMFSPAGSYTPVKIAHDSTAELTIPGWRGGTWTVTGNGDGTFAVSRAQGTTKTLTCRITVTNLSGERATATSNPITVSC